MEKKYLFTVGPLKRLAKEPTQPLGMQAAAHLQLVWTAMVVSPSQGEGSEGPKAAH